MHLTPTSPNILVSNSDFENIGNDAIDGSEQVSFCKDKAVSAGEKSIFKVNNCRIINNEIGMVSKDQSLDISENNELYNNKT